MKELSIITVGTGYFSQFHYDAWNRIDNVTISGICSLDVVKAKLFCGKYNIKNYDTNLDLMIKDLKPKLIDIITPPETHKDLIEIAISHGVDVIVQKPFARTFAEAEYLSDLAEKMNVNIIVHENFRFMPWYRVMKGMIDAQILGDIFNVQFNFRPGDGQGVNAYLDRQPYFQKMHKFLIHETAIHFIDTFRYLFGEVEHVYANLRKCNPIINGEDSGMIIFNMENNIQAVFDGNRLLDYKADNKRITMGEMLIEGSKASIRLDGDANVWLREFGSVEEKNIEYEWVNENFGGDCVFNLISHVVSHYLIGTMIENRSTDYIKNIRIEDAIYKSNESHTRIKTL